MILKLLVIILVGVSTSLANGDVKYDEVRRSRYGEPPMYNEIIDDTREARTQWIEQKLDNFDPENNATWLMRYMENDQFFTPGGPMFIYVGGEWSISSGRITSGHIFDMAEIYGGYLFYTEHRFYGQSKPTEDMTTEDLQHLSVDQALADLAHFIEYIRATYEDMADSQVILIGGSYSASMVTWFRRKYPELISGAWATSAPLLAKVEFGEFKEVVGEAMRVMGSEECYNAIEIGFQELDKLFDAGDYDTIKEVIRPCPPFAINSELEKWYFYDVLGEVFTYLVQTNRNDNIAKACDMILAQDTPLLGIGYFFKDDVGPNSCVQLSYAEFIRKASEIYYGRGATRPWWYQTCTEYGWYQSTISPNQPFGPIIPVELYFQICVDLFGERFTAEYIQENVDRINTMYGGMSPEVTNVFFTHGGLDPWRPMGIVEDYNEFSPAMVIPNASHMTDLGSISETDSPELRAVKERIIALVGVWLGVTVDNSTINRN